MAADPDAVAKARRERFRMMLGNIEHVSERRVAFTDHYYNTFDANRSALASLYQEHSFLTFEGQKIQGPAAITQKLTSLPFQQCQHRINSLDSQPSLSQGILIFVTGQIMPEGETKPLNFSQVDLFPFPRL